MLTWLLRPSRLFFSAQRCFHGLDQSLVSVETTATPYLVCIFLERLHVDNTMTMLAVKIPAQPKRDRIGRSRSSANEEGTVASGFFERSIASRASAVSHRRKLSTTLVEKSQLFMLQFAVTALHRWHRAAHIGRAIR
jgi:hypothetical protein